MRMGGGRGQSKQWPEWDHSVSLGFPDDHNEEDCNGDSEVDEGGNDYL